MGDCVTLRYHPGPENDAMPPSSGAKPRRWVVVAAALVISAMITPFFSTVGDLSRVETLAVFVVVAVLVAATGFVTQRVKTHKKAAVARCKLCGRDVNGAEDLGGRKPCMECGG